MEVLAVVMQFVHQICEKDAVLGQVLVLSVEISVSSLVIHVSMTGVCFLACLIVHFAHSLCTLW